MSGALVQMPVPKTVVTAKSFVPDILEIFLIWRLPASARNNSFLNVARPSGLSNLASVEIPSLCPATFDPIVVQVPSINLTLILLPSVQKKVPSGVKATPWEYQHVSGK